jgi:sodium/bile acid cotransporter 7
MAVAIVATGLLCVTVLSFLWVVCDRAGLGSDLRAAVVFCGSQKSLAQGVPMARLIFGAHPGLSLILLPIMTYHPLQLSICGPLAGKWAGQQATLAGTPN